MKRLVYTLFGALFILIIYVTKECCRMCFTITNNIIFSFF